MHRTDVSFSSNLAALSIALVLGACGGDPSAAEANVIDVGVAEDLSSYQRSPNRRVLVGGESANAVPPGEGLGMVRQATGASGFSTDSSGKVEVQIVECSSGSPKQHNSITCDLDPSYVLVGGGAEVVANEPGALLTESRPLPASDASASRTWMASSKDHHYRVAHTLHAWAIGIRVKDDTGTWMPASTLANYVRYRTVTSSYDNHPNASCVVPAGYVLIGGGAKTNWVSYGSLLTQSYPVNSTTWFGAGKDHRYSERTTVNVYCIGIQPFIPGVGQLYIDRIRVGTSYVSNSHGTANGTVTYTPKSVPTSWGGRALFNGRGRMLTRISPATGDILGVTVSSKDHYYPDSGATEAYLVQVRAQ